MNLITITETFSTQQSCILHLEGIRWGDDPRCPHCKSDEVARKKENNRVGRWNCHQCHNSFNVLQGTLFQKTKIPLQKWFLAIALMVNAKKSLSSCQLARDLQLTQQTAWFMQQRIRLAMVGQQRAFLKGIKGIVEMDETYLGGKPRKKRDDDIMPPKRGRGTTKTAVMGAVERGDDVVARVTQTVTGNTILKFI